MSMLTQWHIERAIGRELRRWLRVAIIVAALVIGVAAIIRALAG